jgi:GNAT superfamily N-acetyltransferase
VKDLLRISARSRRHEAARFHSGVEDVDRYFRRQAAQDQRRRVAATFVLTAGTEVYGYYTLSAAAVVINDLPAALAARLRSHPIFAATRLQPGDRSEPKGVVSSSHPILPVTLLQRLAVSEQRRGLGIGGLLLADALLRSLEHSLRVASVAVIVRADDVESQKFYRAHGFERLRGAPDRLALPMGTIASARHAALRRPR